MIYPTEGPILRNKVKLAVLKGFSPTEPNRLQSRFPITAATVRVIKSGMFITPDNTAEGTPWKLIQDTALLAAYNAAVAAGSGEEAALTALQAARPLVAGVEVFVALPDGDDHDVQSLGQLIALNLRGDYEIQTPYASTETFRAGDELTLDGAGLLAVAKKDDIVIAKISAYTTKDNALIDLAGVNSSAKPEGLKVIQCVTVSPYAKA